jgi:hypothetical protein
MSLNVNLRSPMLLAGLLDNQPFFLRSKLFAFAIPIFLSHPKST